MVALVAAFLSVPTQRLPAPWMARYHAWVGEPSFNPAPADPIRVAAPLDLDQICPPEYAAMREAVVIAGVAIEAVDDCMPDNPWDVAVAVLGSNNVSQEVLTKSLFAPDAIDKGEDRDGDGDPDVIHIRLEVMELNGRSPDSPTVVPRYEIAPGITPGFWVFAPKSRGMTTISFESPVANRMVRLPGPVIRVEQGDEISVTLENTHYLPHTIHFHGVDHPFETTLGGNDGVPLFSERALAPGAARTYRFTPRRAGTSFYHCHVQPHSHILMGLQGMFVVEENRPDNRLQTFNIGAGRVWVRSAAVREEYAREYDLHYLEVDRDLNDRIQRYTDPRLVSRAIHRGYNITQRRAEYYLLNGRSFPYTLRESLVVIAPDEKTKLRVLNGGNEGVSLHFHGHKPTLTHADGVALEAGAREQRDVFWIAAAQRVDLLLDSTNDGLNAYGEGAWLLHDHREQAVTTDGIGPGGDLSLVVYESFLAERGLPRTVGGVDDLALFFDPAYYRGELPVFTGMGMHHLNEPGGGRTAWLREGIFWMNIIVVALLWIVAPLYTRRTGLEK
ncbi:MAG: multicopper oxidase domain-containing protein [Alphaproteobacteria bacterium]